MTKEDKGFLLGKVPPRPMKYNKPLDFKDFEVFVLSETMDFVEVEFSDTLFLTFPVNETIYAVRITNADLVSQVFVMYDLSEQLSVANVNMSNAFSVAASVQLVSDSMFEGINELINEAEKSNAKTEDKLKDVLTHWNTIYTASKQGGGIEKVIAAALCYFYGNFNESTVTFENLAKFVVNSSYKGVFFFSTFQSSRKSILNRSQIHFLMPLISQVMK